MKAQVGCEELDHLKRAAAGVLREVKTIRRSKDLSFYEDVELGRQKRLSIHLVLKHLLVGHDGKPCPCAGRPIVRDGRGSFWLELQETGTAIRESISR